MTFIRTDTSIDPVQMVYDLCVAARANAEQKKSRWIKRMIPISQIRKTLSVELQDFAREIVGPYFHSNTSPKKVGQSSHLVLYCISDTCGIPSRAFTNGALISVSA